MRGVALPEHIGSVDEGGVDKEPVFAMVGNPNSGKTTLFNHLTGLRQKVANYAGVTVEKKEGVCFSQHGKRMRVVDLPGTYSLSAHSPDEKILQEVLMGRIEGMDKPDRVICVVDGSNLERNLYLAAQVAELGRPTLLVLNMMDIVEKHGLFIDTGRIEKELGVTVVTTQAHKKEGVIDLKLAMSRKDMTQPKGGLELPELISEAILNIQASLVNQHGPNLSAARGEALLLLTEGADAIHEGDETADLVAMWQRKLDQDMPNWRSQIIRARYEKVGKLVKQAVHQRSISRKSVTEHLDSVLLHKTYGWLAMVMILGTMFWSIFSLSEYPMGWIEEGFAWLSGVVGAKITYGPLRGLVVDGILSGLGAVLVFLPQIMMVFLFIGVLESSGYLPRAAFLLDRYMSKVGLQGKSFIPLLSSYACAVPGILSTRVLRSKQERFATIMIAPWMSCSARLPIYLLMIATLVPGGEASAWVKAGILLLAYGVGTFAAFCVAWLIRKTILKGDNTGSVMELPHYRVPCWRNMLIEMARRAWVFLRRAGVVILAFSIIIWYLIAYPGVPEGEQLLENSYIGKVGKAIEPVIEPLGFDWRVGVGVLGSFAARELFISTMAVIYNVESDDERTTLAGAMRGMRNSDGELAFTPLKCVSLMVFFIFAMQCVSTLVVARRETNSLRWPAFMLVYMTGFAYLASLLVYQGGRMLGFV